MLVLAFIYKIGDMVHTRHFFFKTSVYDTSDLLRIKIDISMTVTFCVAGIKTQKKICHEKNRIKNMQLVVIYSKVLIIRNDLCRKDIYLFASMHLIKHPIDDNNDNDQCIKTIYNFAQILNILCL